MRRRQVGSNAPRIAHASLDAGSPCLRARSRPRRCSSRTTGQTQSRCPPPRRSARAWSYPRSASRRPRERHPGDRVRGAAVRPRPWRRRARPRRSATRELQPMDRRVGPGRRTGTARERRSTGGGGQSSAAIDRDGRGRPHRSHHGGPSASSGRGTAPTERPRTVAATRAPRWEDDVERPARARATLAAHRRHRAARRVSGNGVELDRVP